MPIFKKSSNKNISPDETGRLHLDKNKLRKRLEENIKLMQDVFKDDDTLVIRRFENHRYNRVKCCAFFIDGMVDNKVIDEYIIQPIVESQFVSRTEDLAEEIMSKVIVSNDVKKSEDLNIISQGVLIGDTVVFIDGCSSALIVNSKGWQVRGIQEPDTEKALRGPREGFGEAILINLSLIRRKIQTPDLKFKFKTLGTRSNTKVCVCWIDSLADEKILDELNRRLDRIQIDGILDSNYISELIKDNPKSPFKTIGTTERPDAAAAKLLEGRVAVIVDGTPIVLTLPYLFIENFQSSDDYYLNFYFASIGRFLRILGFFMSISVPAIYVAFITFHREMIPTNLAMSIMRAHQGIPFPTILECVIMLIIFEIIRETGIRMPSNIGQALSIVGALVIGQAAVEAKFISAPMVIIVAITAITGLINPKVKGAVVLMRFSTLFAAAFLGLYGYAFLIIAMLAHLFSLESFGVIYTSQMLSRQFSEMKDTYIRVPWQEMKTRPTFEQRDVVRKK